MLSALFKYAVRNILRTRIRSFITLLSIILIITLYTVLTSIGNSFTNQIDQVIKKQDIDIAVQARFSASPLTSKISSKILTKINKLKNVAESNALLVGRKRLTEEKVVFILGVSDYEAFSSRLGFNIVEGESLKKNRKEVSIGEKVAKVIGLKVGDTLKFGDSNNFQISGVFTTWLNLFNSGVIIDLEQAQELTRKPNQASLVFLTLKNKSLIAETIDQINKQFPSMRAVDSLAFPNHIGPLNSFFILSKIVSILTLLIALAVLLNSFIIAISERTKEIGILSAIGWSRAMIISVFLIESLILAMCGGILGYLMAFPLMWILQKSFTSVYMFLPNSPEAIIFLYVLLISLVVGVLSSLFPALYGTRIQIAKAFHHE